MTCTNAWPAPDGSIEDAGWDYGTNLDFLKVLVGYWQREFDWRRQEARLNQFAHFRARISRQSIHFVYERGMGPDPMPLDLVPLLADPKSR